MYTDEFKEYYNSLDERTKTCMNCVFRLDLTNIEYPVFGRPSKYYSGDQNCYTERFFEKIVKRL
jgi:hypothetical protein